MSAQTVSRALLVGGLAFVVGSMAGPNVGHANTVTYTFSTDLCTGGCGPQSGGFGTVQLVDAVGGGVDVTVTLSHANKFVSTGAGDALGFDLLGNPSIAVTGLTTGFTLVSANPGSIHLDGSGNWEYAIACTGCGPGGSSPLPGPLSFHIASVTTAAFVDPNNNHFLFVSHILSGTTRATGDVAVPVPGRIVGTGLPGLVTACSSLLVLARRLVVIISPDPRSS